MQVFEMKTTLCTFNINSVIPRKNITRKEQEGNPTFTLLQQMGLYRAFKMRGMSLRCCISHITT